MNDAIRRHDGLLDPSGYQLTDDVEMAADINPRSKRQTFAIGIETVEEDIPEARFTISPLTWTIIFAGGIGAWALIIFGIRGALRVLFG